MVDILYAKKKKLNSLTSFGNSGNNFTPFKDRLMVSNFTYLDGSSGIFLGKRSEQSEEMPSICFSDVALVPGALLPDNYLGCLPTSDEIIGTTDEFKLVQIDDTFELLVLGSMLSAEAWEVRSPYNLIRGVSWELKDRPHMQFILWDVKFALCSIYTTEGWYKARVSRAVADEKLNNFMKSYLFNLRYRKGII